MKQHRYFILFLFAFIIGACQQSKVHDFVLVSKMPAIFPDYTGTTIPYNIAPLNFKLNDSVQAIKVEIIGKHGKLKSSSKGNKIQFNIRKWKNFISQHKGEELQVIVSAHFNDDWHEYLPFTISIAQEPIDEFLVYRLILPGYQSWNEMGIYQRSLGSFRQEPILTSKLMPGTCMNCHSFAENDPQNMVLHLRENNNGTLLVRDGKAEMIRTKTPEMFSAAAFPYWHPSKKYIAFSTNKLQQIFHSVGPDRAHVIDLNSDIVIYDIEKNEMVTSSLLFSKDAFETFPCFHPDGKTLYFCSAPKGDLPADYNKMKYSLYAVSFDPETGILGDKVDTLISASQIDKSVSIPRISPDGRFIMFNLLDYGSFPAYNPESDIYLYDLHLNNWKPLDKLNSDYADSYHSWSNNGRWVVFSSRRIDGLYSTPFIAYIDEEGNPAKPFLLPQKDADFYKTFLYSFNIPEFVKDKVTINSYQLEDVANKSQFKQVGFRGIQQQKLIKDE